MLQYLWRSGRPAWKAKANEKAETTRLQIPTKWRIDETKLAEFRARQDVTGDVVESLLLPKEVEITRWTAATIATKIQQRHCSAVEVTTAFCHRAAVSHQLVNCLHEIFFDGALERARQLDAFQYQHGDVMGPFHGVPISLKDQFYVRDVETTMGYVGWIGTFEGKIGDPRYRVQESLIVKQLQMLGAILYCKTSLPQTLLLGETHNNIFGYTVNPINQRLSCGGSSGGEGALLALGGSCLGIGTDIGGSVRIPASFCGVYAIKPSQQRFSYKDMANSNPGQTGIKSAVGFMATSLLSLKLIQTALLSLKPWESDHEVIPLPWRTEDESVGNVLTFGIFYDDGYCKLHPPVERALSLVKTALSGAGHEVLAWRPPAHRVGSHLHNEFMRCDGGHEIWQQLHLSGEPVIEELKKVYGNGPAPAIPLIEFQRLVLERDAYRQRYNEYWNSTSSLTRTGRPVDAVVMAVAPHAAVIPGKYFHYGTSCTDIKAVAIDLVSGIDAKLPADYSDIVNLLDYTSVVIPVTTANQQFDIADPEYAPLNQTDKENWMSYDAEVYDGAPVGVQIIGRRLQEERCISLAMKVEEALHTHRTISLDHDDD